MTQCFGLGLCGSLAGAVVVFCGVATSLCAQTETDQYQVYTDHPRLILTAQRLRLLKRERERESQRWRQFDLLVKGGANLPEPGFALALYYAVSGDETIGKRAIEWALGAGNDLRQIALVYDWCQPMLTPQQSAALVAKIQQLLQRQTGDTIATERNRVLAMIATADDEKHGEQRGLADVVQKWWNEGLAKALSDGTSVPLPPDAYPLLELMHAIRDNLKIDLRDDAPDYFKHLPEYLIAANYPAAFKATENDVRIPMYQGDGPPDLNRAALARAAGLSMVAYDNNALENQFLQGWLIQDRFLMMNPFGAPYEFLWANPYQPGLSYYKLPLVFHDATSGVLFVRSAWDDDADWFGLYHGEAQRFHDGQIAVLTHAGSAPSSPKTLHLGQSNVIVGRAPLRFSLEDGGTSVVIGLKPDHKYLVETDDEEMREVSTDRAGNLVLEYPSGRRAGVRVHE